MSLMLSRRSWRDLGGRAMRNKGLAAGNHALRLYVSAMRLHGSRHYPHGPSAANGLSGSTSCMRGVFRAKERVLLPRSQESAQSYVFTSHDSRWLYALSCGRFWLLPVSVPINRIRPIPEKSAQAQGTSKCWSTYDLLCRPPSNGGDKGILAHNRITA